MPTDARILDQTTGQRLNYTCENNRFKTDISRGHPHGIQGTGGSAYAEAILLSNGWSLWLEHVVEKTNDQEWLWLMWYEPNGRPTIPLSGVFTLSDLEKMVGRLLPLV
jgi:hypothetical protein